MDMTMADLIEASRKLREQIQQRQELSTMFYMSMDELEQLERKPHCLPCPYKVPR